MLRSERRIASQSQPTERRRRPRVVLGGGSLLFREGLRVILSDAGLEVVGHAGDGEDLVRKVAAHRPDVVVVDLNMPAGGANDGLRAAIALRQRCPETGLLVLAERMDEHVAAGLLAEGADGVGCLLTDRVETFDQLLGAIRRVADGGSILDPEVVSCLLNSRRPDPLSALTIRQRQVLALIAEGRSNLGIARQLVVSEDAVEKHVRNILRKLDIAPAKRDHQRVRAVLAFIEGRHEKYRGPYPAAPASGPTRVALAT
jgi:DNA-binding NarL/FixJ family response regulator